MISEGIVVATSRPETMFADVAVAVHPDDERYKDIVGKTVILPLVGREIPVIADPYPDPEKGTGAVKITPSADPNDFEVGLRHNLAVLECIDEHAKMTELSGRYAGQDRYECRKNWVADLEAAGYLVKTEKMTIPAGECYRCHTVVEPRVSEQWFVKMKPLAEPAIKAVREGETQFVPDRFDKIYYHWMEDIKDWCISRQLWWGHRIPAYYCDECGEMTVAKEMPKCCPKCGCASLKQDEDVLDTWFSSALWPFSTLGWPNETADLKKFYPTQTLVTGYDIIFFWVARMIFSSIEEMGSAPYRYVLIHGLVRDAEGRKMSKSLGNGIDPLEVIDSYGADALRFMLLNNISPGSDMRFVTEKLESSRNFANKLWNASRFAIMNLKGEDGSFLEIADEASAVPCPEDLWMLGTLNEAVKDITANMEKFEFALAAAKINDLIWNNFCDWYIELIKPRLWNGTDREKADARYFLVKVLKDMLKLLHPFMPFITEEIYGFLPKDENSKQFLMLESWPKASDADYSEAKGILETAMEIIRSVRNMRTEADAAPSKKLHLFVKTDDKDLIEKGSKYIQNLANISEISFVDSAVDEAMSKALVGIELYVPMDELLDYRAEYERMLKEKSRLEKEVERAGGKLANEKFTSKAPAEVIQQERDKLAGYRDMLEKTLARISQLEEKVK